ncbi:MAG: PAS domain S-box protein [Bryobacteraceae bacterium]
MGDSTSSRDMRLAGELADLRQQQRLYRELFEDSLGLMCIHDLDGVILLVNPAAAESLGFSPEEGVGMNLKMFLAPAVRHLFDAYLDRIKRNHSDSGLMRLVSRDGRERIWHYRNVLFQEPETPPRVLGHAQDITDRVRVSEALKESERRFHTMADAAPVMLWVTDREGNFTFVNKTWLTYTGRPLPEETGAGWTESLHLEDREGIVAAYSDAVAGQQEFRAEFRMKRADGQYRWFLATGTPRFSPGNRFGGYIGSCVDVTDARQHREALRSARDELAIRVAQRTAQLSETNDALRREIEERKRVESALRESEQHYQALAELAPIGIFRTDDKGRCLYVNQQACAILGLTAEEILNGQWDRALHPEDREHLAQEWRRVLKSGASSLEHRFLQRDGSTVWGLIHLAGERGLDGRVTGCIGTVADITDRKRAEEERRNFERQIQHAQRLQSLGILAGGIAHDFNNLLTVVLGNARMALSDLPAGSKTVDYLLEVEAATMRAADLTGQMLAYSGKGQFTSESVDLSKLARETANLLHTIVSKKTRLRYELDPGLPHMEGDPAQIRQIVMNLITNASEAVGDSPGEIVVRTGIVQADREYLARTSFENHLPEGPYVYLEVADNGCGMDPETQARIFDPFFTTKFTGRGLGLAAVMGIVRGHRGAVHLTSQKEQGSVFRVLFPVSERPTEAPPKAVAHEPARKESGTVLVVDDEAGVRNLTRLILEDTGYTVLTAVDGGDAVQVFRDHAAEISAVLLDMTMPVMSGEDALSEIRKIRADVPVILCSGYSFPEAGSPAIGQAAADFLKKPYDPAELADVVRKAMHPKANRPKPGSSRQKKSPKP